MQKKIYLKNPLRLIVAFLLVMLMTAGFILLFHSSANGDVIPEYTNIVIAKGDTLWGIAKQFSIENEDIRNKISEIKKLNNINFDLRVGQELIIRIN